MLYLFYILNLASKQYLHVNILMFLQYFKDVS